jgi:hypothetical protein
MPLSAPIILLRFITALLLAALGEFCVFGFLASQEPGSHLSWQIGYSLLALCSFTGAIWLGFGVFELQRVGWIGVIVGLCLGAFIAFCLAIFLFMVGPRGDVTRPLWGISYGLLFAPIGAAIGSVLGAWIGSRFRTGGTHGSAP